MEKLKIIIFYILFIKKIFAENDFIPDNDFFGNETVGSLLPRLHLNHLKTKALHDLTSARLRHLLPFPRRHHLLLEETPSDFLEDINETVLDENFENDTNNFFEVSDTDNNNNKNDNIEDILETFKKEHEDDNKDNITEMMKKMFYYILDEQKKNSLSNIKNSSLNEDEKMNFRKMMEENVKPFVVFNPENLTGVENYDQIEEIRENKEVNDTNVMVNEEVFDRLKNIFTEIVKNELNMNKSTKPLDPLEFVNRKRRNTDEEDYLSNDTVLNHLHENEENLRNFGNYQKLIEKKTEMRHENLGHSWNDPNNPFKQQFFKINFCNQETVPETTKSRKNNFDDQKNLRSAHHKGGHSHHFTPSHGMYHNPSKHPPNQQFNNNHNFHTSNHQNPHSFKHYTSNDFNPYLQKMADNDYTAPFIIQAPPNHYYDDFAHLKRFKRSVPLLKLIADPNVKLDMPKTMENIGTVAKNSFEDDKAPMFHIRNMVGSAKNVILAALRVPPQDVMIPTQYKIMDRSDLKKQKKSNAPEIVSRFLDDSEEDKFLNTFKRMGFMLRESIKSGQETLQHMTDVAHSARKAFVTTGYATPRFITPYVKATAIKKDKKNPEKLMLIAPRIGEVTDEESQPDPTDDYVKIGDLMDAFGVSNPEKNKVGLTRFVVHPKKNNKIQSRFGDDKKLKNEKNNKDFFIVAEHIDDEISKNSKSIKNMVDDLREKILKKSKSSKNPQYEKLMENLFPLKNGDDDKNEISGKIEEDFNDILNFDWEKLDGLKDTKEIDTNKLKPNQNVDYNELYQKIVNEKL